LGLDITVKSELNINDFLNLKEIKNDSGNYIYKINKLNIENCPRLNKANIRCLRDNKELTINNCGNLIEVDCYYNQLEKLNTVGCPKLENLHCASNNLTELNLKELSNLKKLNCSNNPNIKLDITEQNHLEEVFANKELSESNEFLKNSFVFYSGSDKYAKQQNAQE